MGTNRTHIDASTITELLVTMIVTGIIMIAMYDGLDMIVKSYHHPDRDAPGYDISSHILIESLIDDADSCIVDGPKILFYRAGYAKDTVEVHDNRIELRRNGQVDRLFGPDVSCRIISRPDRSHILMIIAHDSQTDTSIIRYGFQEKRHRIER